MQKTWLAEGITNETGPTAKRVGAEILGRALAHEYAETGDISGYDLIMVQAEIGYDDRLKRIAITAGLELLGG